MPVLFAATLFLSAMLLFMVQPMVGKMILPLLGGSPAAWNTCMVFFQGLLLLGYFYSHKITGDMTAKRQTAVHLGVLCAICMLLVLAGIASPNHSPVPVFRSLAPQGVSYPMFGVLALLFVAIGFPFLVVSTSAPLLQRWFNYTGHPSAKDPYFLYAASNAGSLLSLLGYPIFMEPNFTLVQQAWIWAVGFLLLTGMVYLCAQSVSGPAANDRSRKKVLSTVETEEPDVPPTAWDKLRWIGYAFVPSSLMLGVTFHMTTDIASVPLLWVIPLALYLLTFIIAFSTLPSWFEPIITNLSPVMTLLLVFVLISSVTSLGGFTAFMALGIHTGVYFTTALLMHYQLAQQRPKPKHLTNYFIWISVGGVLGGIFNALVAPMVFKEAYEYPIAIAVGCMLVPVVKSAVGSDAPERSNTRKTLDNALDLLIPLGMFALVIWLTSMANQTPDWLATACNWTAEKGTKVLGWFKSEAAISGSTIRLLALYALPCVLCFFCIDRPIRFGLCVAALLGVCTYRNQQNEQVVASMRSFFGILRVEKSESVGPKLFHFLTDVPAEKTGYVEAQGALAGAPIGLIQSMDYRRYAVAASTDFYMHKLLHGTTLHGMQAVEGNSLATFLTDPGLLMDNGRVVSRELAAEALTRDYARMLSATNAWEAAFLAALPNAWDFRQEPLTYYHRTGPVGEIFRRQRQINPKGDIGMVGLGTGSAACYVQPGQRLTFYEIDTAVIELVEGGKYFTFVKAARDRGAKVDFVLGDARLQLEEQKDRKFAVLLVDAFSSDSIPVHLLTKESIELYKQRLAPGGLLALHISNRYVELEPVVAKLAEDAKLQARVFNDNSEGYPGKTASSWVVLANSEADLGPEIVCDRFEDIFGGIAGGSTYLTIDNGNSPLNIFSFPWRKLKSDRIVDGWRDDYADVLRVMRMDEIKKLRRFFGLPVLGESDD